MPTRVKVSSEQYLESLGFTLWVYKTGKIGVRDLIKGSNRAFGEFLEHTMRGKIAELAFKNFLFDELAKEVLTEVDLPVFMDGDYLPDVTACREAGSWKVPAFWVDIKAEVEGHKWMLIRKSSLLGGARTKVRRYDAYANVKVSLPADHIARILKHAPEINAKMSHEMIASLADLSYVEAEVLGYALLPDLLDILSAMNGDGPSKDRLDRTFGPRQWAFFKEGENAFDPDTRKGGAPMGTDNCAVSLSSLRTDWQEFIRLIDTRGPSLEGRLSEQTSLESQMTKAIRIREEVGVTSWFDRPLPPESENLSRWFG